MNYQRTALTLAFAAAALLQACTHAPDPAQVQGDIAKAQAAGHKDVVDAQAKLAQINAQNNKDVVNAQVDARANDARNASSAATNNADAAKARSEANRKIADAQFDVDQAKATAAFNVAQAKCESLQSSDAAKACTDSTKATYAADIAAATSKKAAVYRQNPDNG